MPTILPVRCLVQRLLGEDECSGEKFSLWTLESLVDVIGRDGVGSCWWWGPYQSWKAAEANQEGNPVVTNHLFRHEHFCNTSLIFIVVMFCRFFAQQQVFYWAVNACTTDNDFLMGSALITYVLISLCYHYFNFWNVVVKLWWRWPSFFEVSFTEIK